LEILSAVAGFLTEPWVLLSFASALGYASIGFIDEWLLEAHGTDQNGEVVEATGKLVMISGLFGFVISAMFAAYAVVIDGGKLLRVDTNYIGQAVCAGMLEVVWLIPYFHGMQRSGTINAAPLFQTIPIFSLVLGLMFFAEIPAPIHLVGSLLIVAGAFLLNTDLESRRPDFLTIAQMLTASCIIALIYFLFKDVVLGGNFVAAAFWSGCGMLLMTGLIWLGSPAYRKQFADFLRTARRKEIGVQFGNEALNSASVLASQFAVAKGPSVMLVTSFNAFHPVFTLAIGWCLSKAGSKRHVQALEGTRLIQKSAAIVLIAVGTVFAALE
jgi:uncharacterized membrane protein